MKKDDKIISVLQYILYLYRFIYYTFITDTYHHKAEKNGRHICKNLHCVSQKKREKIMCANLLPFH